MGQKNYPNLLSICIPSYNRGHRAFELVKSLLGMECVRGRDYIEIVVSDNGSTNNTEGYAQIKDITDSHVVYHRNKENLNFHGNYNTVIKLSTGHYSLLISDEDSLDEAYLEDLISMLEEIPDIGMMKARTSIQYTNYKAGFARAGYDAIKEFYLQGNYISGTLYNRDYVTDELIDGLYALYNDEIGYKYYPHLFVEAFVLNLADFYFFDKCLVIEGESEEDKPIEEDVSVLPFSTWESRTEQLVGYLRLIHDIDVDDDRKQLMFASAVWRTIWMIGIVREKYIRSGKKWSDVVSSSAGAIMDVISKCGIPVIMNNMEGYLKMTSDFIKKELL